jgi:hypothetical protein
MEKKPVVFNVTLVFIIVNVLIWLVFGILILIGIRPFGMLSIALREILAALAVLASGTLFALFALLRKQNRIAYYLTLVALVGLVLLTFMDQVGIVDLAYLVLALTPFVLLIISRRWYFKDGSEKR